MTTSVIWIENNSCLTAIQGTILRLKIQSLNDTTAFSIDEEQ